jgi:hypothetical protein
LELRSSGIVLLQFVSVQLVDHGGNMVVAQDGSIAVGDERVAVRTYLCKLWHGEVHEKISGIREWGVNSTIQQRFW